METILGKREVLMYRHGHWPGACCCRRTTAFTVQAMPRLSDGIDEEVHWINRGDVIHQVFCAGLERRPILVHWGTQARGHGLHLLDHEGVAPDDQFDVTNS